MKEELKAVIYARYSSDSQREASIEGQLRDCYKWAQQNDIEIVDEYIDRAMTGRNADRPDLQRMIADSDKHIFNMVIVWKLDRFARDRFDSAHYKHILKKNGVKLVSAMEHIPEGPEGILMESVIEGMAEYYSAELAQKIRRGQRENALKGLSNGGTVSLGLRIGENRTLEPDPHTAPIVLEVFQRVAELEPIQQIIDDLRRRGIKTARGMLFSKNSLTTMLRNKRYIGYYIYGDIVIPNVIPPIVPEELFYKVQDILASLKGIPVRAKGKNNKFLLTTKLFCGHCGTMMAGESGTSHNGAKHYYYKCSKAKRKLGCHKKAVKKDAIEQAVVRWTVDHVLTAKEIERVIEACIEMQRTGDKMIPVLEKQLVETQKGIDNIVKAIEAGIFSAATKDRLDFLEETKQSLIVSINERKQQNIILTRPQLEKWFSQFLNGDITDVGFQEKIIDNFVNSVYLFDDHLVITYNYQRSKEKICFSELSDAGFEFGTVCSTIQCVVELSLEPRRVLAVFGYVIPLEVFLER